MLACILIVLTLAGALSWNLSYCRRSIISKAFYFITKARKQKNTKKIIKFRDFVIVHEIFRLGNIQRRVSSSSTEGEKEFFAQQG